MLNTNGLRIAEDEEFVRKLGEFKGGFEIYLQFDGFDSKIYSLRRTWNNIFPLPILILLQ